MRQSRRTKHLLTVVDEVLTLARIEAGREVAQREAIDVETLMHAAAELVARLVAAKGLTCAFQTPGDRLSLTSDPVKVRQVLVNLLANAVKFTDRGGITFAVRRKRDTVIFEVRTLALVSPPRTSSASSTRSGRCSRRPRGAWVAPGSACTYLGVWRGSSAGTSPSRAHRAAEARSC